MLLQFITMGVLILRGFDDEGDDDDDWDTGDAHVHQKWSDIDAELKKLPTKIYGETDVDEKYCSSSTEENKRSNPCDFDKGSRSMKNKKKEQNESNEVPPDASARKKQQKENSPCNSAVLSCSSCSICCEDYQNGDVLRILSCHHAFHKNCMDSWAYSFCRRKEKCPTCPLCKQTIFSHTEESAKQ